MATTVPVVFRASPLPQDFKGTPQQFLDAITARLTIEAQDTIAFFVTGSVAPTSNVGPWLKNGITWYVWDVITAAYIPEVLEFQSLRYIALTPTIQGGTISVTSGSGAVVGAGTTFLTTLAVNDFITANGETHQISAIADDTHLTTDNWNHTFSGASYFTDNGEPDPTIYTFWIQLSASGKAQGIFYYSGGAWKDVYEDRFNSIYTKTETDSIVTAAVANLPAGKSSISISTSVAQVFTQSTPNTTIQFNTIGFDDGGDFNTTTFRFTAPENGNYFFTASLRLDTTDSSSPTGVIHVIGIKVNGISQAFDITALGTDIDAPTPTISRYFKLSAGSTVEIYYQVTTTGGTIEMTVDTNSEATTFQGFRVS